MRISTLLFNIIFALTGWIASIATLASQKNIPSYIKDFGIIIIALASFFYIVMQIFTYIKEKKAGNVIIHENEDGVNSYLLDWLKKGGNSVIFTRNLSWGHDEKVKQLLIKKAKKNDLSICLYEKIPLTDMLESHGAKIYAHGLDESRLRSRFTIVDYGTHKPRITVGTKNEQGHFVNERYYMDRTPNVCHSFIELYELVKSNCNSNQQLTANNKQLP